MCTSVSLPIKWDNNAIKSKDWYENLINVKGLDPYTVAGFFLKYSCVFNLDILNNMLRPETNTQKNVDSIPVHSLVEETDT